MANNIAVHSESITDTAVHSYPDTPSGSEGYSVRDANSILVKVDNGLDQSVDVTLYGSTPDDKGMSADVSDGTATVSAGSSAFITTSNPWDVVRATATASTAPTSGTLTVAFAHQG